MTTEDDGDDDESSTRGANHAANATPIADRAAITNATAICHTAAGPWR